MSNGNQPREALGTRMKSYEAVTDQLLASDQPAIIRIDGHGFSKFTHGFEKPFDERIHQAMARTSADLLTQFPDVSLVYTQSDEITLILPTPARSFNGRVTKLATLAASYTSVRFNFHLEELAGDTLPSHKRGVAHFDARIFNVPSDAELLNNLIWRAKTDCRRNSISAFGRKYYSAKAMHGLKGDEVVQKVRDEHGVDFWTDAPAWARYGTTCKREVYQGTGVDGLTGKEVTMTRTRVRTEDRPWWHFTDQNVALVTARYWDTDAAGGTLAQVKEGSSED
ncbi:unnamed protein product [Mycena citricolor]|uniref:tRNA(His) guanylyltransferase n=1 Tax=Mycena citricolor TaxID=2018698 RepID=A0AAD2JZ67_9AGAR|nr:unnamed protein product [Mycena citricolor]